MISILFAQLKLLSLKTGFKDKVKGRYYRTIFIYVKFSLSASVYAVPMQQFTSYWLQQVVTLL